MAMPVIKLYTDWLLRVRQIFVLCFYVGVPVGVNSRGRYICVFSGVAVGYCGVWMFVVLFFVF